MPQADATSLERFVLAQAPVLEEVLCELGSGRKRSHWMWFIFPQLRGLGLSSTSQYFGVASVNEARAYLAHRILGPRLELCTRAVLAVEGRTLHEIFGSPDDLKFCSSMTLFSVAAGTTNHLFQSALDRFCGGHADHRTVALLQRAEDANRRSAGSSCC
jgi:uncharacterized protein (DUF1810 family)